MKKYIYGWDDESFENGCTYETLAELFNGFPELKPGDTISRAEIYKPTIERFIDIREIEWCINGVAFDEAGVDKVISIPAQDHADLENKITRLLKPYFCIDDTVFWLELDDYVLTEKDFENDKNG